MAQAQLIPESRGKRQKSPLLKKRLRKQKIYFLFSWPVAVSAGVLLLSLLYFFLGGFAYKAYESLSLKFWDSFKSVGFKIDDILIEGRTKTPKSLVIKAIELSKGDSLFSKNLDDIKNRLLQIEWIKDCIVYRELPDKLYIKLIEREPIALWYYQKRYYLVDETGSSINPPSIKPYMNLPLLSGEGASTEAEKTLKLIKSFPEIQKNMHSLMRVRKRRWDLILFKDFVVKLPEDSMQTKSLEKALWDLMRFLKQKKITPQNKGYIDFRLPNKITLKIH